jgi:hypothetical protein
MHKCRLIIIDPVTAFVDGMGTNSHEGVRRLFNRLTLVAKLHDAAVVVITHTRKEGGDSFLHRAIGSQAFTITSRVVYTLVDDPVISERRLLLPAKMNLLPPRAWVGRAFRIGGYQLHWEPEPITLTPDELRYLVARGIPTSDRLTETVAWLKSLLAAGPRPSREILDLAHAERIPRKLLFEARARAGVRSRLHGHERRWYSELTQNNEIPDAPPCTSHPGARDCPPPAPDKTT